MFRRLLAALGPQRAHRRTAKQLLAASAYLLTTMVGVG
jgi:hypothetical protein